MHRMIYFPKPFNPVKRPNHLEIAQSFDMYEVPEGIEVTEGMSKSKYLEMLEDLGTSEALKQAKEIREAGGAEAEAGRRPGRG